MAIDRSVVLVTSRAILTTWCPDDLDDLLALHSDPDVMRYMRSGVQDRAATKARLEAFISEQQNPGWTRWRVVDGNGRMIGRAGVSTARGSDERELGYVLERSAWGLGLASELAAALVAWHRTNPDAERARALVADCMRDNGPSRRVLEKAGLLIAETSRHGAVEWIRYRLPD